MSSACTVLEVFINGLGTCIESISICAAARPEIQDYLGACSGLVDLQMVAEDKLIVTVEMSILFLKLLTFAVYFFMGRIIKSLIVIS